MTSKLLPLWDQLPELDLYLDHILILVNNLTDEEKSLTASMVNNYVKHQHIDKPIKKKYQRHQVARLIGITFLKNVFSIQEISDTLTFLLKEYSSEALYNNFVQCLNDDNYQSNNEIVQTATETLRLYFKTKALVNQIKKEHF